VRPHLRLGLFVASVATLFLIIALSGSLSADRVRSWVDGYGVAGPLVFIVVSSCLTVAMFPGPLLAGASGLLFGTALGTPVSIVAATTGACMAFLVSRRIAHDAVEEMAGPRVRGWQAWIEQRGFMAVLYARIAPAVPYNVVNYVAGLTRVSLGAFAAGTALGAAPRAFAYTALGGSFGDFTSPETIIAIVVLVVMAIGGGWFAWRDEQRRRAAGRRPDEVIVAEEPPATAAEPGTGSSSPAVRSEARR
jgi:uncharacterized membrane protein YdjX (TVP38/TMEM64 family)